MIKRFSRIACSRWCSEQTSHCPTVSGVYFTKEGTGVQEAPNTHFTQSPACLPCPSPTVHVFMHMSWASVGPPCACVHTAVHIHVYLCQYVHVCVGGYTHLRTSVHVCICVHVSPISEMEAETAAIPLLLLCLCFPRQIVSQALSAEPQTASRL